MLFYSYFIFVAFLSNRFPRLPWPYASKQASLAIDAHVMEHGGGSRALILDSRRRISWRLAETAS